MKQHERSMRTKTALSNELMRRLAVRDLEDIGVTELTRACNLDRKTFYYHFVDIYDLYDWSVHELIREMGLPALLQENAQMAVELCATYVTTRPEFVRGLRSPLGSLHVKECIAQDIYDTVERYLRRLEEESGVVLTDDYRNFLVVVFAHAVGESFVELSRGRIALAPKRFAEYLVTTLRASMERVVATDSARPWWR